MEIIIGAVFLLFVFHFVAKIMEDLERKMRSISNALKVIFPALFFVFLVGYFFSSNDSFNSRVQDYSYLEDQPFTMPDDNCTKISKGMESLSEDIKIQNLQLASQIKGLNTEIKRKEATAFIDSLKMVYFGIIGSWVFSILLPAEIFFRRKSKKALQLKFPSIGTARDGGSIELIQKQAEKINFESPEYTSIRVEKINILIEKTVKISLVILISSLIFLVAEYVYLFFL